MNAIAQEVERRGSIESIQIDAIRALTKELPKNDFGLPVGVYRTDLLPFHDYRPGSDGSNEIEAAISTGDIAEREGAPATESESSEGAVVPHVFRTAGFPTKDLAVAFVPLQYDEGYPAFDTGMPFWSRLEYEPPDAYEAFSKYLAMNLGAPATVTDDPDDEYDGKDAQGTRSISRLASELHPDSNLLQMIDLYKGYSHLYYWGLRAQSYDLCRVAQYRKQQEHRAIETQDEHYIVSRRLRHRLMTYMNDDEEFWGLMTPKVGLDMLKTVTQLERISAGLPASGPMSEEAAAKGGTSFEMVLRTVALDSHSAQGGNTVDEEGKILDKALEDPKATQILQELIIRSGGG